MSSMIFQVSTSFAAALAFIEFVPSSRAKIANETQSNGERNSCLIPMFKEKHPFCGRIIKVLPRAEMREMVLNWRNDA
jgi:hypothetical protein